jgi:tyrosinase
MKDALLSAGDPVFLLFHAHIDNIVWKWQQRGLPGRLSEIGGSNLPSPWYNALNGWQNPSREWMDSNGDHGTETTLNHVLYLGGVCRDVTIGEVINSEGPVMCARYE